MLDLGADCFFCRKRSAVCRPHLQAFAEEEVDQLSAVCKEKKVCFFSKKLSSSLLTHKHTQTTPLLFSLCLELSLSINSLSINSLSLSLQSITTTTAPPPPSNHHHHLYRQEQPQPPTPVCLHLP
ncbi:hypothetical protein Hanom_Chr10g00915681 [Helianthus anomalus]